MNTKLVQDEFTERMLFDQLQKSHVLKEDIAHYNRQDVGHEHNNGDYLNRSVTRHLERTRKLNNCEEVTANLSEEQALARVMPSGGVQQPCAFHGKGTCKYGDSCANKYEGPAGGAKGSPKGGGRSQGQDGEKGKGTNKGRSLFGRRTSLITHGMT